VGRREARGQGVGCDGGADRAVVADGVADRAVVADGVADRAVVAVGLVDRAVVAVGPGGPSAVPARTPCPEGMIAVPGGTFKMGSPWSAIQKGEAGDDEIEHEVTLSPYCIDRTEVTVAAYAACAADKCPPAPTTVAWKGASADEVRFYSPWCNGGKKDRDDHPINCVNWNMADTYCKWVSKALPTEAQWEFAARGLTGHIYPWGDEPPAPARLNACGTECRDEAAKAGRPGWITMYQEADSWPTTAPVGEVEGDTSAFGVRDMGGNVVEWVADVYAPYALSLKNDPRRDKAPAADSPRVIRGGGWRSDVPRDVRAAFREGLVGDARFVSAGFRCARGQNP
jgi:formylglycine-generating enzyme required for sulfatase activity